MASRISAGAGDLLEFELRCSGGPSPLDRASGTPGGLRHTHRLVDGIDLRERLLTLSAFPARQVSAGWLRSLVHAQHMFLGGTDPEAFIPDLQHGLVVQRLIRRTVEKAGSTTTDYMAR